MNGRLAIGLAAGAAVLSVSALAQSAQEQATASPNPVSSQPANTGMSALQDRSHSSPAEALFVEKCAMCHRQLGMGTAILSRRLPPDQAMLERRSNLAAAYVVMAVRRGIGNMPRIPRGEVSDAQLKEIADYLSKAKT